MKKTFKKITSLLLILTLVLSTIITVPFSVSAVEADEESDSVIYTSGDFEYQLLDDNTAEITDYKGKSGKVVVPQTIDDYTVTSIGDGAFQYGEFITEIILPDSITNIGSCAFWCTNIEKIDIPSNVKNIGAGAFGFTYLKSVDLPYGISNIGESLFAGCVYMESITIPDSVTGIGSAAFEGCLSLSELTIPDGVTSIEENTFYYCSALKSITIPDGVTSIGDEAFSCCKSLSTVNIPESITIIRYDAFKDCSELKSINYNAVRATVYSAFSGCNKLEIIYIGENVEYLSDNTLLNCVNFTSYNVSVNNSSFCSDNGVLFNKEKTKLIKYPANKSEDIYAIPDSVTVIEQSAFAGCKNLTSVTIPDNVTSIKNSTFLNCTNLKSINIPDNLTDIGYDAFNNCANLESITIPYSVTSIGKSSFDGCESITIFGYEDTCAQTYANDNNITFVSLGEIPKEEPVIDPSQKCKPFADYFLCPYVDGADNKIYILSGNTVQKYDISTGANTEVYDFSSRKTDAYVDKNKLYYLYYGQDSSYYVSVFNYLSETVENTYKIPYRCCKVGTAGNGDILISVVNDDDIDSDYALVSVKPNGTVKKLCDLNGEIYTFEGYDSYNRVYYNVEYNYRYWGYDHLMCGSTFGVYDGDSFEESLSIISSQYQIDMGDHYDHPVNILDESIYADHLGNIYTITENGFAFDFSFRSRKTELYMDGYGSLSAFISDKNLIVGKSADNQLYCYSYPDGTLISLVNTEKDVYCVLNCGEKIVCIEYDDSDNKYYEIFELSDFINAETQTVNLNEEAVYSGRTKEQIIQKYNEAIGDFDFSTDLLADPGSAKSPYKESVIADDAYDALMNFTNYQRWLAGLTPYEYGDSSTKSDVAKGAVLLAAADTQGHNPSKPSDMDDEFYNAAIETTGGNINYGRVSNIRDGINALRELLDDTDSLTNQETLINISGDRYYQGYNTPGHRNTLLQRGGTKLTYGAANRVLLQYYEYGQYNPNKSGTISETNNNDVAYAWPAPGAFPSDEIDKNAVWTIYFNTDEIDFSNNSPVITVTDLDTGEKFIRDTLMHDNDGERTGYSWSNYWGKSLSFTPPEANSFKNKNYKITVENLENANGISTTLEYTINFFSYEGTTYTIDGTNYRASRDGKLYVLQSIIGDVNSDGSVNAKDRMTLTRYLAKWSGYENIDMTAADVNSDNAVNAKDRMILTRHLAKWQGYETLPLK